MATYSSSNDFQKRANSIKSILNKLLVFRKKITSNYIKNTNNNNDNVMIEEIIKNLLEEDSIIKNQIDSNQLYSLILIKYLDKIIEELIAQSYTDKKLKEEIMNLVARFKKSSEETKNFEEIEDYLHTLESQEQEQEQEQERARILIIFSLFQELNEQHKALEIEKISILQDYTKEMRDTVEGARKANGTLFTEDELNALHEDLVQDDLNSSKNHLDKINLNLKNLRNTHSPILSKNQNSNTENHPLSPVLFRPRREEGNILDLKNSYAKTFKLHGLDENQTSIFINKRTIRTQTSCNLNSLSKVEKEASHLSKIREAISSAVALKQKLTTHSLRHKK